MIGANPTSDANQGPRQAAHHFSPKRIFLTCRACNHETVFHRKHRDMLARLTGKGWDELTVDDVIRLSRSFRCKRCGAEGVYVREEERALQVPIYVASGMTGSDEPGFHRGKLVFHRDECEWVGYIHKATMIRFRIREQAIEMGFSPCRYCKP